ncbi:MAG: signal peptidase I [Candidatus Colwellbacteria bacterium RBG_13_48_8]|uniref:Signal peptidase I n=1 Tax=Candidatus Colwellbacteria bacterium RBG_13_48_8 TaxID=1797685 RepID=A0A1G1YWS9_9BACT|nr:MAG: signal peptidase I [Candidatus Colwellbacteria bacterium RBG_13_48_8]
MRLNIEINCIRMPTMKQFFLSSLEVLEVLIVALVSIQLTYAFVAQPFRVEGSSMEPNFYSDDYLIVDEISYRFRSPERGEVIVLRNPTDRSEFFIKRIVGLPGEELIIRGSQVFIDGEELEEGYLPPGLNLHGDYYMKLSEGQYFVMGDNRLQSFDSRSWGPLARDQIVGTVRMRFWPLDELKTFKVTG